MAFPPSRNQELNTFVLAVLNDIDGDPTNIVSPRHPLWASLDRNGNIEERPPGFGPVEDITFETPDRSTDISLSHDLQEQEFKAIETETQARFDWFAIVDTLTIPKMQLDNTTGPNGVVDIAMRKKKAIDMGHKDKLVNVLFNGRVVGTEVIFGMLDFVQTATASNPTKGSVGGIDQTVLTGWKNNVRDFDEVYKVESSGLVSTGLPTQDANSMYKLWEDCIAGHQGDLEVGRPDIIVTNSEGFQRYSDLVDLRLAFRNINKGIDLAADDLFYRGASLFYDASVPDESSGQGVMYFLNTNFFSFVFASGLRGVWGDMFKTPGGVTGFSWERSTQVSITVRDRSTMGVIHGIKDVA